MTEEEIRQRARQLGRRGYDHVLRGDPENGYIIEVSDLPGCSTGSPDLAEAFDGRADDLHMRPEQVASVILAASSGNS